ncbi:hypothetical protein EBR96_09425 [bacterium]|nr:hypothetical protein [bacterium]
MWKRAVRVVKYNGTSSTKSTEYCVIEKRCQVTTPDGNPVREFVCSSGQEKELIAGYLIASKTVSKTDIGTITPSDRHWIWEAPSTKNIRSHATKPTPVRLPPTAVLTLTAHFQEKAILYKDTGATHSAAIATDQMLIAAAEDISVENAIYKSIGKAYFDATTPVKNATILLITGVITKQIIDLADYMGYTWVITRSSPTERALDLAIEKQIGVIGFARGTRFSVYTLSEKI